MSNRELILLLVTFASSIGGKALFDWWRLRQTDKAHAGKLSAEARKALHDSEAGVMSVSQQVIVQWIESARAAEKTIQEQGKAMADLREQVAAERISKMELESALKHMEAQRREAEHALGLCKDAMKRCQETHGCPEV